MINNCLCCLFTFFKRNFRPLSEAADENSSRPGIPWAQRPISRDANVEVGSALSHGHRHHPSHLRMQSSWLGERNQ